MAWNSALTVVTGATTIIIIVAAGLVATPFVFAQRVTPGVYLGDYNLTGVPHDQLRGVVEQYAIAFEQQPVTIKLRDKELEKPLGDLGVSVDVPSTVRQLNEVRWIPSSTSERLAPRLITTPEVLRNVIAAEFASQITLPQDATLQLTPTGQLVATPSKTGEGIDSASLEQEIKWRAQHETWSQPIEVVVISTPPTVHDGEIEAARTFATRLLKEGMTLQFADQTYPVKSFTIQRLLQFTPVPDPNQPDNQILGVTFDRTGLIDYLKTTIESEINQPPVNARFERQGDKVTQFAVPKEGRTLNLEHSTDTILSALEQQHTTATLAVDITEPAIRDTTALEALGVTALLASGESDFKGSPKNRIHNIEVGTSRYHGLLIEPGQEFSFNEFLGPVDGAHGFLPELVIKHNVTTPEYGGGLCQVSSTLFRAAVNSGLEITQRRNHAYAVSYYGTPGFDATIYPPYTDLRFINNTPGYILIQARIDGTKLYFEFWGTDDGRQVEIVGPSPYDRQPDGSVKATLKQKVTKDGATIIDETFYSRYRSPKLFPKVLAADDPAGATVDQAPVPANDQPTTPTPTPKPSATPKPTPSKKPTPPPTPES